MGSWEAIKMDPSFGISDKILPNEDKKPQAKHLQLRTDYLLRILQKKIDQSSTVSNCMFYSYNCNMFFKVISNILNINFKSQTKPKRQKKTRETKPALTKEIIEDDPSSNDEVTNTSSNNAPAMAKKAPKKQPEKLIKPKSEINDEIKSEEDEKDIKDDVKDEKKDQKKKKREKKESKKKKKVQGPMHFTANSEPRALDVIGDLDPSIFNEV